MDRITQLRAERAALHDQMEALVASLDDDGGMSAEQSADFEAMRVKDDKLKEQIDVLEDIERRKAEQARPVGIIPTPAQPAAGASVPATPAVQGLTFARMTRYLAAGSGNVFVATQIAEANGDSGLFANQNMGSGGAGGFLVPEDVSAEIIELLRPRSVVRAMGPRVIPLPNGNLTTNRRATGATFGYVGEQQDVAASGMTFGQMKLSAKKFAGLVPISNDLLRSASTSVDMLVRDDIVEGAASSEDLYFLRGPGTENAPLGLRNQLIGSAFASLNVLTMTASPDLQKIDNDLGRLELAMMNQSIDPSAAHWVMSPRSAMYLTNLRDGNGNKVYPEMSAGQLRMKPVKVTNQIPSNLGGGTESEIGLIHPSHVVIGEQGGIAIAMSTEAAYKDSNGTMQAAFSRDETLMRLIMHHDIGLRHLPAVAWLTGVTWGV
ncbi:phage major capsid protein [Pararhodobacter zhoushanensis]|uniref:phage major capsid protein n=1 Tax=Pararhodobacter zhoushanensis TaxID=2479545 RepID=UPI000F8D805D|nr:phage major capsid protein [Pararhodobacter zhoushanensis]